MRGAGSCLGKESAEDSPEITSQDHCEHAVLGIPAPCPLLASLRTGRCLKARKDRSFQCCSAAAAIHRGTLRFAGLRSVPGFPSALGIPAGCSAPACSSAPGVNSCKVREVTFPFRIREVVMSVTSVSTSIYLLLPSSRFLSLSLWSCSLEVVSAGFKSLLFQPWVNHQRQNPQK